nr:hypothetical protein [Tanacetum cinerariifolium]
MMDESDLTMEEYIKVQAKKSRRRGKVGLQEWIRRIRLISFSISGRGQAPEKVTATDLFYMRSMDRGTDNISYLLAQYLFRHAEGRRAEPGSLRDTLLGLMGLSVIAYEFSGPKRQPIVTTSVPEVAEGAPLVDEGVLAVPSPVKAPHPPPTAAQTMTMP